MPFRIRLVLPCVPLLLAGAGCARCDIEATASELAGEGATDCGFVADGGDGTAAWACAVEQFAAGAPFHLRDEHSGMDSTIQGAWVFNGTKTWKLHQDDYGSSNPGIDGYDCIEPFESVREDDQYDADDVFGYPVLACTSLEPEGTHYTVCGEICGPAHCGDSPSLPFEP